ncbi:MAG: glycosidase [Desulfurococcales archaeon]|nr:glycosidase [Desulfurococcales archaeon]
MGGIPGIGRAVGAREASGLRVYEVRDEARRLGTITADRLFLNGFPARNPVAVFNPGMMLEGGEVLLYPRIIVGYYKYVSAIVEARIPLDDVLSGYVTMNSYSASLAVTPSTPFDLWGAEDPRVYQLGGVQAMTYTGRTLYYFEPGDGDRTLPVTAVRRGPRWVKAVVHRPPPGLAGRVSNDKNAFLLTVGERLYLFHRPQLADGRYLLLVSELPEEAWGALSSTPSTPVEVAARRAWVTLEAAGFEEKIAWGAPPIHLGGGRFLLIMHGVGRAMQAYRVFAAEVELHPSEGPIVRAVTPRYIMEPREPYEVYGDRPYTVFPCGAALVGGEVLASYGAADYMAAFASIPLDSILSELDRGRVY